jgi:serine/threonine protein kinase
LLKVCSDLVIGPQVEKYFGFDMLMFSECVEFAMEYCQPICFSNFKPEQLYEALAVMHRFQLIHNDIKPENIMYSPYFKRMVLIDFGLSRIVNETVGAKTMTYFRGNVKYCSP